MGHTSFVTSVRFLGSEGQALVSCAGDGSVRLWDRDTGKEKDCFRLDSFEVLGGGEDEGVSAVVPVAMAHLEVWYVERRGERPADRSL